jgi:hypothetical protein
MRYKINYSEGDWVGVPLPGGGWAVGLVARMNRKGAVIGYFFGPRRDAVPTVEQLEALQPDDAILVGKFGDLGLVKNEWPVIGRQPDWDRDQWPIPVFVRRPPLIDRVVKVWYDETELNWPAREEILPAGQDFHAPEDGLMGYVYVQNKLEKLLGAQP